MITWTRLFLILALLVLPAKGASVHNLMIMNAQVPASLTSTAKSAVAYFTIMNHGTEPDALIAVTSPSAKAASMHESVIENDVATMSDLARIEIAAGAMVELQQGGQHIMFTGLNKPLKKGDKVHLELTFEKAGQMPLDVVVGEAAPGHMNMNME